MKIRNGFVSNSSSSSFAISVTKGAKPKMIMEIDLEQFEETRIKTVKKLDNYFFEKDENYKTVRDILIDEYDGPKYKKMFAALNRGEEISIGWVHSDGGDVESELIYQTGLEAKNLKGCEIIWNNNEN